MDAGKGTIMVVKKRFKDLNPGELFYYSWYQNHDASEREGYYIKTKPLYFFDAEKDDGIMKVVGAVRMKDGRLVNFRGNDIVEIEDYRELDEV